MALQKSSAILYLHNEGLSDNMAWCHTVAVKYSSQTGRQMKQACQNVNSWGVLLLLLFVFLVLGFTKDLAINTETSMCSSLYWCAPAGKVGGCAASLQAA